MPSLSKTGIEYGDLGWNFYPGCLHKPQGRCPLPNCWAEGMSKRKREDFHKPRLIPERLLAPLSVKKPSTILVNFMGDLMGDWVDPGQRVAGMFTTDFIQATLKDKVFDVMKRCPQHRFLFLTKNPAGYAKWGEWPDNAWLGASVWNSSSMTRALACLSATNARHKWLSIEPLIDWIPMSEELSRWFAQGIVDWVVIGGQTNPVKMPELAWVREIVEACDRAGVKVWLKNNLKGFIPPEVPTFYTLTTPFDEKDQRPELRQELPV